MSDMVAGLRLCAGAPTERLECFNCHSRMIWAADEIERLRAELAEARRPDCTLCTHVTVNDSMNAFECGYNNTGAGTVCIGGDKFIKDHNDGPVRLYEKEGKV